ncbi:hypothetical protein CGLO_17262 [Colletotrichum gloeosporioides Cg-14]|uniref:Uncharacterized protein n=1 Tax=Colletotrichum gloeosporioides (strain Cg-14) TaxID=1237896 RepID=T0JX40_COLGC|nr:hypothetical protein CGLO_17262 [Colletotrichum gloeosporioides Cg-14]
MPARPQQLGPLDAPGTKKPGTGYFGWTSSREGRRAK